METHLTEEQIAEFLALTSPTHFKQSIPFFAPETLARVYQVLSENGTKKSASLAFCGIEALKEVPLLEAAGKGLSASFFLQFFSLDARKKKPILPEKISPLLVGLPQAHFRQALHSISGSLLSQFKKEGIAEPMQHHLLLLAHEIQKENNHFLERFSSIQKEIEELAPETLTEQKLIDIRKKIHALTTYYEETIDLLDKALAIAWNTNRPDLIDLLTSAKEAAHRQNWLGVGENADRAVAPYSLCALLEARLEKTFGEPDGLLDSDPAIEGLAKLSLWYLSDYALFGLIPPFAQEEHELAPSLREKYLTKAQENLTRIGLKTVKDLKDAEIYSQQMLRRYIEKHAQFA